MLDIILICVRSCFAGDFCIGDSGIYSHIVAIQNESYGDRHACAEKTTQTCLSSYAFFGTFDGKSQSVYVIK